MTVLYVPGTPGTTLYAGRPTPSVGGLITTLSLVNTSGSTQAANFVSPMLGMPFVAGDLPSGEYPVFTLEDDTPCPATIYNDTSWPDLSKKFCGVFFRTPTAIAGSTSLTINVNSAGSAPAASSRSLSDLTAADLKVEVTGVTNLSGVWVASLNTAITDAVETIVIGDGPAGKLWRIRGPFKQSGAAHGQLECYHYVLAAENNAGGLSHIEYLPRVAQPWGDVSTPTPTRRVLTCVLKSGATTLLTMQGHDTTETPGSNIAINHYGSFFVCSTDARWNFVQGGGTTSARPTVRVVHDKTHVSRSRLISPQDLTISATSNTSVDYNPGGRAGMQRAVSGTGERDDIGLLTAWSARHLLTQAAVDERVIRAVGLSSSSWRVGARRSTTGQIVPVTEAGAVTSWTGLGTTQPTWRLRPGDGSTGFVTPSDESSLWISEFEPSHRPAATYYPYLVTGEPQYLDLLVEQATNLIANRVGGTSSVTTSNPVTSTTIFNTADFGERDITIGGTTTKGGGHFFYNNLTRVTGWGWRDMVEAAAIYPDTCPSGTEVRKYLRDVIDASLSTINTYNGMFGAGWSSLGVINFDSRPESTNPWNHSFLAQAVCHGSQILPSTPHNTLRAFIAQFWENIADQLDISNAFAFGGNMYDETLTRTTTVEGILFTVDTTLTFSTSTNRATISATNGNNGSWTPTNGDVFAFAPVYDSDNPFTGVSSYTRLYAVNCSGQTLQLSLTPGGSPLTVTSNAVVSTMAARIQNFSPNLSFEGYIGPQQYISSVTSAIRFHAACGDSVADALSESSAKLTSAAISYTGNPKYAMSSSYPS